MGNVIPFPRDRGRSLSSEQLRAYRDGLLALLGKLLTAVDDFRLVLAPGTHETARTSLLAARGHLSALNLGPAALARVDQRRLGQIAAVLLLAGQQVMGLAKAAVEPVTRADAGQAGRGETERPEAPSKLP